MPPIVDDCGPSGQLQVQAGDVSVSLVAEFFDRPVDINARVSVTADLSFVFKDSEIILAADNIHAHSFDVIATGANAYQDKVLFETILREHISRQLSLGTVRIPLVDMGVPETALAGLLSWFGPISPFRFNNTQFLTNPGLLDFKTILEFD